MNLFLFLLPIVIEPSTIIVNQLHWEIEYNNVKTLVGIHTDDLFEKNNNIKIELKELKNPIIHWTKTLHSKEWQYNDCYDFSFYSIEPIPEAIRLQRTPTPLYQLSLETKYTGYINDDGSVLEFIEVNVNPQTLFAIAKSKGAAYGICNKISDFDDTEKDFFIHYLGIAQVLFRWKYNFYTEYLINEGINYLSEHELKLFGIDVRNYP